MVHFVSYQLSAIEVPGWKTDRRTRIAAKVKEMRKRRPGEK
jgi:hypothetical protein